MTPREAIEALRGRMGVHENLSTSGVVVWNWRHDPRPVYVARIWLAVSSNPGAWPLHEQGRSLRCRFRMRSRTRNGPKSSSHRLRQDLPSPPPIRAGLSAPCWRPERWRGKIGKSDGADAPIVAAIKSALQTAEGRGAAQAGVKELVKGHKPAEAATAAVAQLKEVMALVSAKQPDEAQALAAYLRGIAQSVAEAAKRRAGSSGSAANRSRTPSMRRSPRSTPHCLPPALDRRSHETSKNRFSQRIAAMNLMKIAHGGTDPGPRQQTRRDPWTAGGPCQEGAHGGAPCPSRRLPQARKHT